MKLGKIIMSLVIFMIASKNFYSAETETWNWISECREYHKSFKGEKGVVCFFGDSISYMNECSVWAVGGNGRTTEDKKLLSWMHVHLTMNFDYQVGWTKDGYWLTYCDVPGGHSYTSSSGITTYQYRDGTQNLPSIEKLLDTYKPEMVLIMLGTNDFDDSSPSKYKGDIEDCIKHILYEDGNTAGTCRGTIPIMSTLPPRSGFESKVKEYNLEIKNIALKYHLPFVDFYGEIMDRQPNNWRQLIDGLHPTGASSGYTVISDPYKDNGKALKYVGALLRCFVNFQKIKQVKYYVIDEITPVDSEFYPQDSLLSYPNPFNPECFIPYEIRHQTLDIRYQTVKIKIYNILGQVVKELDLGEKAAGSYVTKDKAAYWNGRDSKGKEVVSGVYYYELVVNGKVMGIKKSLVVR